MMKTPWAAMVRRRGRHFPFHPADSILQAYRDGALNDRQARRVTMHLQECPECRQEDTEQAQALQWFLAQDNAAREWQIQVAPDGLMQLEQAIDTLALSRSADGEKALEFVPVREESREETLSELQYYLGKRIVQDLMSQVPDSPEDTQVLLHKAEPYLTTFLGQKAATQICFKISQAGAGI